METELKNRITELLDCSINEFWLHRISNSVYSAGILFKTNITPNDITHQLIDPNSLWVVSEDELDFTHAYECLLKYRTLPPPVTVLENSGVKILFMGSVRALIFALNECPIDSIVISINNVKQSHMFSSTKKTLREYVAEYKGRCSNDT